MKTNAIVRIVIWSIVLVALIGIMTGLISDELYLQDYVPAETAIPRPLNDAAMVETAPVPLETIMEETPIQALPNEQTLTFSPDVKEIEINWVAGDIIIMETDVQQITLSESDVSDTRYSLQYQLRGNKLDILFCEDRLMDGFGISFGADISKDLYIQIPRSWEGHSIEIDAAAANVELHNITLKEMDFDGASGTADFQNCHIYDLYIDTASGDVYYAGTLETLDFDAASASFIGDLQNTPSRIGMDSMDGTLDIALPGDCGFTLTMDGMHSRMTSDFTGTSIKNGSHVYGDGHCRIDVNGLNCDVNIRKLDASKTETIK